MRKPHVGAQQFIWLLIATLTIFIVGIQKGKKENEVSGLRDDREDLSQKQFSVFPLPVYPNEINSMRIGDRIFMDGFPMQVKSFETYDSPEKIIAFYKEKWKEEGLEPYDKDESENYKVCGAVDKARNYFMTVSTLRQASGKTLVFPSFSKMTDLRKPTEHLDIPHPETLSRYKVDFDDFGQKAQNDVSLNSLNLEENMQWYQNRLSRQGWKMVHHEMKKPHDLLFMFFQKEQRHLSVSIHYDRTNQKSAVLMNITN